MSTTHTALTPFRLGGHDLASRFVVAPMSRVSATPSGVPTPEMADYYGEFAAGGFPLVITEGVYVDAAHSQSYLNQPGLVDREHVAGWRAVTDRVHATGGLIFAQLMHAGALSQGNPHRPDTIAPSAVRPLGQMMPEYGGSGRWPVPRAMTLGDIEQVVAGFAAAARNAAAAGFDGVELHAANGYLFDQFLTTYTNQRDDEYGGSTANRIRLTTDVVAEIRRVSAPGFLVGVRLSQTKVNDLDYRWPGGARDAETVFTAVADAGADYLHVASEGRDWLHTATLPGGATITGLAREVTGLPVIANGGMHDAARARQVLDEGHADLLAIGRGALANPDLPHRLAKGLAPAPYDRRLIEPAATLANAARHRADQGRTEQGRTEQGRTEQDWA
ncbi:oxidoreductase [Goodfellowiella coeruleoviolacea]|uniref:2,4-dienoyl-CoA reductase n=1 Tax=Goodfellowiella coeruleoviolacea TaxID=334858 RepID=A0AAE3KJX9_9PSEU|nr:NADH:flavin oxidoreductase [Goodfellowiella coeruleoviolacea]MCP2170120.1 2,4-dienoyl-CoA reductase [Goodfellowiella coeruleoviolacea]